MLAKFASAVKVVLLEAYPSLRACTAGHLIIFVLHYVVVGYVLLAVVAELREIGALWPRGLAFGSILNILESAVVDSALFASLLLI